MEHYEDRFDFHGLGLAIKDAREKRGWTQEYLAELVGAHVPHDYEYREQRAVSKFWCFR